MKTGVFYSGRQEGSRPHGAVPTAAALRWRPLPGAEGLGAVGVMVGWWGNGRWGGGAMGSGVMGWWIAGVPAGTCTAGVWAPCTPSNSGSSNCPVWFRTGKRGQNLFQAPNLLQPIY